MEPTSTPLHPLLKIAAISVSLFALVGIGVMTGVIPTHKAETPAAVESASTAAAPAAPAAPTAGAPAAAPAPQAAAAEPAPAPAQPASKPKRIAATKPAAQASRTEPMPAVPPDYREAPPRTAAAAGVCRDCGTIASMREVAQKGEGTGLGAVAGGAVGGLLGSQVGSGRGQTAATVLGVVGGAVAGHEIEKRQRKTVHYEISVRMDDGSTRTIQSETQPAWRSGDRVKVVNGALIAEK